ncbi:hypothetical protein JR316_0011275 [Psilocybe cubensis]|uniref:Uncharacterized protein n=2 Tax=Psilocybe cubensis TaxID=181762 RepID=A0ACB8GJ60_PSICU|nr:hypothetical protein JR316_0011275 [Psilocybe cubensis]KAH9475716.1 hypothetical protein JR316_0011275 [Psilocybe cubensis]
MGSAALQDDRAYTLILDVMDCDPTCISTGTQDPGSNTSVEKGQTGITDIARASEILVQCLATFVEADYLLQRPTVIKENKHKFYTNATFEPARPQGVHLLAQHHRHTNFKLHTPSVAKRNGFVAHLAGVLENIKRSENDTYDSLDDTNACDNQLSGDVYSTIYNFSKLKLLRREIPTSHCVLDEIANEMGNRGSKSSCSEPLNELQNKFNHPQQSLGLGIGELVKLLVDPTSVLMIRNRKKTSRHLASHTRAEWMFLT